MASVITRTVGIAAAVVLSASSLAACGANDAAGGGSSSGSGEGGGKNIALLLPESQTSRYEQFDKPLFEEAVKADCADCKVSYFNADQDPTKQQQQVETAITQQVDVLVLDPVDGESAATLVSDAQAADIPVIAYDRFIQGADYYMSFDNQTVGQLQGEALVEATGGSGDILMLNGSPTDPNAGQFKEGAHSVVDESGLNVLGEYDNPDWSPENAQKYVTDQLGKIDPADLAGVYAANDGQAGGVIAALTGAGVSPDSLPPVTGQDAELAGIQRIVAGEQYMTIYKPIKVEAEKAGAVAVQLANGETPTGTTDFQGSKAFIFDPIIVTQDKIADTVVADGFYTVEEICTSDYADACTEAGLS